MNRKQRADEGFGLTEVMISMLLLAILFMALISLLITAVNVTAKNGTKATADQLVTQRIEEARTFAGTGDCGVIKDVIEAAVVEQDGRGIDITIDGSVENCDQTLGSEHDQPRLARVTVTAVTDAPDYVNPIVTTTSDIFVKFAS